MTKVLRVAIWLNCLVSVLLALSMVAAWMLIFNAPHSPHLFTAASIISFICLIVIPVLGVSMVVMEVRPDPKRPQPRLGPRRRSGRIHLKPAPEPQWESPLCPRIGSLHDAH